MHVGCVKGSQGEKMHEQWVEGSLGQELHEQYVEGSLGKEMHVEAEGTPGQETHVWRELWCRRCMWGWRGIQPTDNLIGRGTLTMAMAGTS